MSDSRVVHCRSCQAPVIWLVTKNNKQMPVDATTVELTDVAYDYKKHISHFATCPNANQHRKSK